MEFWASWVILASAILHAAIAAGEITVFRQPAVFKRFGYTQEQADLLAPVVAAVGAHNFFLAIGLAFVSTPMAVIGPYLRTYALCWALFTALAASVSLRKWVPQIFQIVLAIAGLILTWLAAPPVPA
ncbi:MAG TPA: DUF1304 family protein [Pirellulales bacterium]